MIAAALADLADARKSAAELDGLGGALPSQSTRG